MRVSVRVFEGGGPGQYESWGGGGVRMVRRRNREIDVSDDGGGDERRNGEAKGGMRKTLNDGGRRGEKNFIRGGQDAKVSGESRVMQPLGNPGSQSLEETTVKGLGWCIGNVRGWCSMLLKGFWHLENLGDMHRSWSKHGKGVGGPLAPRVPRVWRKQR